MAVFKCAHEGCYAQVDERGETCGQHDDPPGETRVVLPEYIAAKETDRRGRFTLGKEYANKRVTVAVIKAEE